MDKWRYVSKNKIFTLIFSIVVFICGMAQFSSSNGYSSGILNQLVPIQSWIGLIVLLVILFQWKCMTDKWVTLYTIFLLFFTVFNFGQCILWAFNIHPENEIGKVLLFSTIPSSALLIVKAQLLYIVSITTLNCGAVMAFSKKYTDALTEKSSFGYLKPTMTKDNNNRVRALFVSCCLWSIIVVPATLYKAWFYYLAVKNFGYAAIGTTVYASGILDILSALFFPCLIGLLIGSQNKRSVVIFVFCTYAIYAILSTLSGDRGEWITRLFVLVWIEYFYYRKVSIKKGAKLFVVSIVGLWIVQTAISFRNKGGVTFAALGEALFDSGNNPIISCLVEFGHSMAIVMILLAGDIVYPYGNTYLASLITMASPGLANGILGTQFVNVHEWFPKEILHINYGSDFSMIGEAVLNYGPYIAPLVLGIFGYFILKITFYPYSKKLSPFVLCMALNVVSVLFKLPRTTMWFFLNSSFYGYLLIGITYITVKTIIDKRFRARVNI